VQTTLLGVAIAIILALVVALVGPLFIDWSRYRAEFEARAAWAIGLDLRITGRIDARLLPTPTLTLQNIEFGRPGDGTTVRARALHIEYALGALVRGEWRVDEARLDGPEFEIGLDGDARVLWPLPSSGFAPQQASIQRLSIKDGRATLVDAPSGSRLVLDDIEFVGSLGSLVGPVKGEGTFVAAGHHYPYRIGMSRIADDGSVKVRLNVDPIDRQLTAEANVSIWVEHRTPRFEGSIAFARPDGRLPQGSFINTPWHLTSRIKGDGSAAVLEQVELQYGLDDQAIKLRGGAKLTFGSQLQLDGVFSAPQLDLDRVLSLPEAARRRPIVAIKALASHFSGSQRLPFPVKLGFSVEALTLAGSTLQRISGDVRVDGETWDIQSLDLRGPGSTQMRFSGRFDAASKGEAFRGSAKIDSGDARTFLGWLTDHVDPQAVAIGSLRLSGDIAVGSETIAIERLNAEIDRMAVLGSFAYSWASNDRPAHLDAALTAPEVNVDRVHALAKAILGDTDFDRPREGALSFKIGRASIGGVEVKQSDVKMRIDSDGLEIEQLAIADFSGAALAIKGRIDTKAQSPRGAVTLDLDARSLEGVTALVEKFAPRAGDELRRLAGRVTPVALRASIMLDPVVAGGTGTNAIAKFKIDGRAGTFRVALQGATGVASDTFKVDNLATLPAAEVNLSGRVEADDGGALIDLVGLDRFIVVDKRPGRLNMAAKGPLDGELAIDGQLTVGALDISTKGTVRVSDQTTPTAALEIKIANASVKSPRPVAPGGPVELLSTSVTLGLALTEGTLSLKNVKGTVAGATVAGLLTIETQQRPIAFDGDLELGTVDLTAAIGAGVGLPAAGTSRDPAEVWRAEPFQQGVRGARGQIVVKATRVALTPNLAVRDFQGRLHIGESQLAVQVIDGSVAAGRVTGELIFLRESAGLIARAQVKLIGAEAAELLPGVESLSGRVALEIAAEGVGLSPIALISALEGRGKITLTNGRLAGLNPTAFETVISAVDRGMPIDSARVRDRVDSAIASGALAIRRGEAGIRIEGGQARMLSNPILGAADVELAVNGLVNLVEGAIDWRLALSAMPGAGAPGTAWPEIVVSLRGPIAAPKRTIDVAAFTNWLALRAIEQQSKKLDALEGREPVTPTPGRQTPPALRPCRASVRTRRVSSSVRRPIRLANR
jgi:uncharacterized protein involved in outer membrane biogenesis